MTLPSNNALTRIDSSDFSTAQGLSHYIQGLQKPSVASVLTDALNNGSLNAMKASTALAADDRVFFKLGYRIHDVDRWRVLVVGFEQVHNAG